MDEFGRESKAGGFRDFCANIGLSEKFQVIFKNGANLQSMKRAGANSRYPPVRTSVIFRRALFLPLDGAHTASGIGITFVPFVIFQKLSKKKPVETALQNPKF